MPCHEIWYLCCVVCVARNPWRAYRHEHIAHDDFSTLYAMEIMGRLGQHRVVIIDRYVNTTALCVGYGRAGLSSVG